MKSIQPLAATESGEQLTGWKQYEGQWKRNADGGCHNQLTHHPPKIAIDGPNADGMPYGLTAPPFPAPRLRRLRGPVPAISNSRCP